MEQLQYPIGKFQKPLNFTTGILNGYIDVIEAFPQKIIQETRHLPNDQLETPYRPGGWSVRQLVNHCADSHMNAILRFKLALTEDNPTIKPYEQAMWAELNDSKTMAVEPALQIIDGIHARWTKLLRSFTYNEWRRSFIHPEHNRPICLDESAGTYAWHCEHHLAHITGLKKRMRWK